MVELKAGGRRGFFNSSRQMHRISLFIMERSPRRLNLCNSSLVEFNAGLFKSLSCFVCVAFCDVDSNLNLLLCGFNLFQRIHG